MNQKVEDAFAVLAKTFVPRDVGCLPHQDAEVTFLGTASGAKGERVALFTTAGMECIMKLPDGTSFSHLMGEERLAQLVKAQEEGAKPRLGAKGVAKPNGHLPIHPSEAKLALDAIQALRRAAQKAEA